MPAALPLRKRPIDVVIVAFFLVNLLFVTYIVDFEQIAIPDPVDPVVKNFTYPVWPPALPVVLAANAPWFIFPFIVVARMAKRHPFLAPEIAAADKTIAAPDEG
jgi:hypothetical protein